MVAGIGWNAGVVRARLLERHRLGSGGRADLARSGSLEEALQVVQSGPYGHDVQPGMSLDAAQWAVAATPLWHLRVLAGWLPPAGGETVRALAGWWEVLDVENLLVALAGGSSYPPYELGRLDTAWHRVARATSATEVRDGLARSEWLDPGADDIATIVTWLWLSWARRVADEVPAAARLVAGWAALVAARDLLLGSATRRGDRPHRIRELGWRWTEAGDLDGLVERLPRDAAWVFDDISGPEELWRAEVRWWRHLDTDGRDRVRRGESGPDAVVGVFATLLADAHGVQGALELAAHGCDEEVLRDVL